MSANGTDSKPQGVTASVQPCGQWGAPPAESDWLESFPPDEASRSDEETNVTADNARKNGPRVMGHLSRRRSPVRCGWAFGWDRRMGVVAWAVTRETEFPSE